MAPPEHVVRKRLVKRGWSLYQCTDPESRDYGTYCIRDGENELRMIAARSSEGYGMTLDHVLQFLAEHPQSARRA